METTDEEVELEKRQRRTHLEAVHLGAVVDEGYAPEVAPEGVEVLDELALDEQAVLAAEDVIYERPVGV